MNNNGIFTSKKAIVNEINRLAEAAAVEKNAAKRNNLIRTIIELVVAAGFTVAHVWEITKIRKLNKSMVQLQRDANIIKREMRFSALGYLGKLSTYETLVGERDAATDEKVKAAKNEEINKLFAEADKLRDSWFAVKEEDKKDKKKKKKADKE